MKLPFHLFVSASLAGRAYGHYVFSRLIINNSWTNDWEYVRTPTPLTPGDPYADWYGILKPNEDPTSITFRCGPNATTTGPITKIADVKAGDTVGFGVGEPHIRYGNYPFDVPRMYHPGPATAWLSKSPTDDLASYTGDGDWFKILNVLTRTEQSMPIGPNAYYPWQYDWGTYLATSWNFTIPATTPPGKYLLRFEQINPASPSYLENEQYYAYCAQVNIINKGDKIGTPGPLVKIQEIYVHNQPEFFYDIWNKTAIDVSKFKMPGPAVWQG